MARRHINWIALIGLIILVAGFAYKVFGKDATQDVTLGVHEVRLDGHDEKLIQVEARHQEQMKISREILEEVRR